MEKTEIVEKFKKFPGIMESGAGSLARRYKTTPEIIKEARIEVKEYFRNKPEIENNKEENLKLKGRWQNAAGKWLESYKVENENNIDYQKIEKSFENIVKNNLKEEKYIDQDKEENNIPSIEIDVFPANHNYKTLLVYTSDKHIGACTKDGLYSELNNYTEKVFSQRMEKIFMSICRNVRLFGKFKKIVICDLGDAIDGFNGLTTRGMHGLIQNMTDIEVFETYLRVHKQFFDNLYLHRLEFFNELEVRAVSNSNHGGDAEYMCHRSLEIYLNEKYKTKTKVFTDFIDHFEEGNHVFLFTHGKDKNNRKFGFPLALNPDTELIIKQYVELNNIDYKGKKIHLIKGDLHQSLSQDGKFLRYKNVGSVFGSSDFIMVNYGYTFPKCDYDIIDERNHEVLEGKIDLQ